MQLILRPGMLLVAMLLLGACATAPYTGRSQLMMMNESEETRLGLEAAQEVLNTEHIETGTKRAFKVGTIGKRIASVADRPDFQWEFHTIKKDELNAFCLPGGKVFVYTGLIDMIGNSDDELAAVMGHEIAHAIARHGAERASQGMIANIGVAAAGIATSIATKSDAAASTAVIGGSALLQLGVLLPYSRLHESEADHIGVFLAAKAGYDPRASIKLWEKMGTVNKGKEPPAILSTHPLSDARIKDLEKIMPEAMKHYATARK